MVQVGLLELGKAKTFGVVKSYGALRDVMKKLSPKGSPKLKVWSAKNASNPNKQIFLKIYDKSGNEVGLNCSMDVSRLLRSKEVSLSQLLDFEVIEHVIGEGFPNAGATQVLVVQPRADEDTSEGIGADVKATVAFKQEFDAVEDLIAYV